MVSCYTNHYRDILRFSLNENGIHNIDLENSLYNARYKDAEDSLYDTKNLRQILSLKIPTEDMFCKTCLMHGIKKDLCQKIYRHVSYIEEIDPSPLDCLQN